MIPGEDDTFLIIWFRVAPDYFTWISNAVAEAKTPLKIVKGFVESKSTLLLHKKRYFIRVSIGAIHEFCSHWSFVLCKDCSFYLYKPRIIILRFLSQTIKNLVWHSHNFLLPYTIAVEEYFTTSNTFMFNLYFIRFVIDELPPFIIIVWNFCLNVAVFI